jgi:RNA polymerase sigma-70 factor (ECF subfamily)
MGQYESLGDENLLTLIAHGDKDALECFYERYSTQVFSLARYMLKDEAIAEEIAQDVFLAVWQKASTFKANRGSPKGWLMSITHHRVIDHTRSAKRARASMDRMAQEMASLEKLYQVRTEDEALRSIERQEIAKALKTIPDAQRTVILMSYFQGYSQSEIAQILDQPLGTVKTRIRLGMQKLRAIFKNEAVLSP